jgi:glycosyltransferase involved in cell wall biosynthesis
MCISPSRGGGFELNALEAASRGVPTLVTNGGCFTDLINYFIPISLSSKVVQPLPGNAVHIGYGYEVDINDLEAKIIDTISRLEYWENRFKNNSIEIREKYSWRNVSKILDGYLKNYGFIE